ncbi:hypothetical protein CKO51_28395 [Rhodopirellula sp. SM50]|nr:hypothetical protein CKO51_28395 [Rhodopirellula sp. SM50]
MNSTLRIKPVDANTLQYLRLTGRGNSVVLVEAYTRQQGLFRTDDAVAPNFSEILDFDLSKVEPSVAGPTRPQDRVALGGVRESFQTVFDGAAADASPEELARFKAEGGAKASGYFKASKENLEQPTAAASVTDGSVVIAAITSCTNTSNPSLWIEKRSSLSPTPYSSPPIVTRCIPNLFGSMPPSCGI